MSTMFNRQAVFVLFSLTVVFLLIVPDLVQYGMFMDGVQYACVSKNMAHGKGSFWFPFLSESWSKSGSGWFLEHPPLSYYLQSRFFILFGDSVYTEKIYGLAAVIACGFFIYKTWRLFFHEDPVLKYYWWLAVLLWFVTPSVFWSFNNNMIENTVSVMVLASVYFSMRALLKEKFFLFNLIVSSFFIFLGSLTKGIPAFFPLAFFICFYLFTKKISFKKMAGYTLVLVFIPLFLYACLLYFDHDAYTSLSFYIEKRLMNRVSNDHLVDNRFTILFWLLTDLFVVLGVLLALVLIFKWKTFFKNILPDDTTYFLFFFALGTCGVIPLCLTHVQRAAYFVPAIPFFGIAFAIIIAKGIDAKINAIADPALKIIRVCVLSFSFIAVISCFMLAGKTSRDAELLEDVHKIGARMSGCKKAGTSGPVYGRWDFQFYLLRYYEISLFPGENYNDPFLIFYKKDSSPELNIYKKDALELTDFVLYKKKDIIF
jgi:hypothetical protein